MANAKNIYTYIEDASHLYLTLADVERLDIGDELDVVIFDRNFEEYDIWKNKIKGLPYPPQDMFRENRHTIRYMGMYTWEITFPFGVSHVHPIHLDLSYIGHYKWVPLTDDDNLYIRSNMPGDDIEINISEIPKETFVGWRGPIIRWNDLPQGMVVWRGSNTHVL